MVIAFTPKIIAGSIVIFSTPKFFFPLKMHFLTNIGRVSGGIRASGNLLEQIEMAR